MLDNLRKKKALARLKGFSSDDSDESLIEKSIEDGARLKEAYGKKLSKEARAAGYDKPNALANSVTRASSGEKSLLADKPIYEALKGISVKDQLRKMEDHNERIKPRGYADEPDAVETEEERRKRILEGLFPFKRNTV